MTSGATNNYALISDAIGNGRWAQLTPSLIVTGRLGIANSNGVYTYYSDFQTAINAALGGQTVELFSDISVGSNVSINLKNGVNINGNGHTYSYSNSLGNCFRDNGVAVVCSINNLVITRTSSLSSGSNVLLTGPSRIDFTGSYFYRNVGTDNYACIEIQGAARVLNAYCISEWGLGIWSINASSVIENSYGQNLQGAWGGIMSSGNILRCTGIGVSDPGISSTGVIYQSVGISVSSFGIRGNTVNCTAISTSGVGLGPQIVSTHRNTSVVTSSNIALSTGVNAAICYNCTFETTTGTFAALSQDAQYYNCSIAVLGGTGSGISNASRVLNCTVRIANAGSNCLTAPSARTTNYLNNVWVGATTPINALVTQGSTNVQDNQGNILM